MTKVPLLGLLLSALLASNPQDKPQEDKAYTVEGLGYSIHINRVRCHSADDGPCVIDYEYSFPGQRKVSIDGVGDAPPSGRFRYITKEPLLRFQAAPSGPGALIRLSETALTRAGIPDVPEYHDFSEKNTLVGSIPPGTIFSSLAQAILNDKFPAGYDPDLVRQDIHYYITAYQGVDTGILGVHLEVAVMLSNPEPAGNARAFRLRWVARRKQTIDPEWQKVADSGTEANRVSNFLKTILASLQK